MSDALARGGTAPLKDFPVRSGLRARIGWICHALRVAAVVWFGWVVVATLLAWSDKAMILEVHSRWLSIDVAGASNARYAAAFVFVLISLVAVAPVVICLWRLAGTYLAGRVFTIDAAVWLRRTGVAAVAAIATAIVARAIIASILAGQIVLSPQRSLFIVPEDLLHLIFAAFVLALAHIFKAAAEMADDHAQIV